MQVDDLYLVTLFENSSIYQCVAVIISPEEATINHLHQEFSAAILYDIPCKPVRFGPNSELTGRPTLARIPIGTLAKEAESDVVVQWFKEECP